MLLFLSGPFPLNSICKGPSYRMSFPKLDPVFQMLWPQTASGRLGLSLILNIPLLTNIMLAVTPARKKPHQQRLPYIGGWGKNCKRKNPCFPQWPVLLRPGIEQETMPTDKKNSSVSKLRPVYSLEKGGEPYTLHYFICFLYLVSFHPPSRCTPWTLYHR